MSKTILIIDDSPLEMQNLEKILRKKNYTLLTASSGKEGIELAKRRLPDLIIMDIVMDNMDGYEATRVLSKEEKTKNIPVIFCSSKNQKADKIWGVSQGGKGYITKPFNESSVFSELEKVSF
jgi:twitching motility two-component system response regulator PilH